MPPEVQSQLVAWIHAYGYIIAYPIGIAEGPVAMMLSGFLVRLGILSFWPIYLILSEGDLTGDVLWYMIGRHGARQLIQKLGRFFSVTEENLERGERLFQKHQGKILFISKITMGFGFALGTLMAAGAARVPFKKYMTINLLGQFIWTGFLFAVGYFLGHLYTLVDKSLRWAFIGGMIVFAALAAYGFARFMRQKVGSRMHDSV